MKFREMRRAKQALSREEALAVLKGAKRGVLSMIGDGGHRGGNSPLRRGRPGLRPRPRAHHRETSA